MANIQEISPRPILLVAGENAHSRYYSEDAYAAAAEPKELMIIPGADHVDLYDNRNKIPFDKLERFFRERMKPVSILFGNGKKKCERIRNGIITEGR